MPSDVAAVVRFVAALGSANPAVRELCVRPGVKSDFAVAAADGGIAMREVIDADAVDYFGRLRSSGRYYLDFAGRIEVIWEVDSGIIWISLGALSSFRGVDSAYCVIYGLAAGFLECVRSVRRFWWFEVFDHDSLFFPSQFDRYVDCCKC